jgi:small subunit ribosomal protein S6
VSLINKYETMLMLDPEIEEERQAEILERFRATVEKAKGKIVTVDDWGNKRLTYEIKGKTDGHYCVVTFTTSPQALAEIERVLGITDDVMRFQTVRLKD